ncbi:Sgd1p [Sugiyamaella lignohabitans]|uniref:Sgd1p n=1 Tax=Sugiyamaella lignohabitans TaxID=796027 RepID=A0A161HK02_9ASCO|nr:Sgd1p [Sugiyamaella lignohabitans]ANB11868.1 Sgd1p [Sugiyamaella lignohabitans]
MSRKRKSADDAEDDYQGIKLPPALLNELSQKGDHDETIHQPSLRRNRVTRATRKENRKLERQKKKNKRSGKPQQEEAPKNAANGAKKFNKKVALPKDDESEGDFDDFDGFKDGSGTDDFDLNEDDFEDLGSEDDSPMSALDTMAALKKMKEKKNSKPLTAADTMAALKAAKEKKTKVDNQVEKVKSNKISKGEKESEVLEDLKSGGDSMSVEETMAALKAAKEGKRKPGEVSDHSKKKRKTESKDSKGTSKKASLTKSKPDRVISERDKFLMAQDEEDIDFYAKKLGLKSYKLGGSKQKKSKDELDDGFDDILGGLDFEKFASGSETEDSENELSDSISLNERDREGERSSDESDDAEDEDDEDEEDEEADEEEEEEQKPKENPYVAPTVSSGKYVPPSKRRLLAQSNDNEAESEELIVLRRQLKGLINRLSESNMGSIINEIEALYQRNPRSHVNSTITTIIIESTSLQGTLLESFLIIHAALVTALYRTMGVEFGAHFVQTLVEEFEKHYKQGGGKEASNLLSLLSEIYTFQLVSCKLMYDFVRLFLQDVNEVNTEFLLKIVRNSGPQLRSDDPSSLKEIIYLLQSAVSKAEPTTINSRTKFLIESITALKNNRQKIANEMSIASTQRMKKFLGTISGLTSEPLQVSLDDIHNINTKGKWWLVGAAYNNNNGSVGNKTTPDVDIDAMNDILDTAEPNWMELAKKQRMNTDVRKAVFVALMTSEDYIDSCDRLQKLRLKSKQEREIPKVILHCCSNEEVYNPFYALVAGKLCGQHSLKKTFQFCLWDFLSELQGDEDSSDEEDGLGKLAKRSEANDKDVLRRVSHLAKFYGAIVAKGDMSLDTLKAVDFLTAVTEIKLFLEIFFISFFEIIGKNAEKGTGSQTKKNGFGNAMFGIRRNEKELAQILIKTKDQTVLRGIQYFQKFVTSSSLLPTKEKQKDRVIWGSSTMSDLVEGLLTH